MKRLIIMFITALFMFISCTKDTDTGPKTKAELTADSLQAVADSLAVMRNIHSMRAGYHLHQNKDLAEISHQNPVKTSRLRRRQYEEKESDIKEDQRSNEQIKKEEMDKRKVKKAEEGQN